MRRWHVSSVPLADGYGFSHIKATKSFGRVQDALKRQRFGLALFAPTRGLKLAQVLVDADDSGPKGLMDSHVEEPRCQVFPFHLRVDHGELRFVAEAIIVGVDPFEFGAGA